MKTIYAVVFVATLLVVTSSLGVAGTIIGVNFCDRWETPHLAGETADGFSNWTDSVPVSDDETSGPTGTGLVLLGSSDLVTCDWNSSTTWAAGPEGTSEEQLYRVYLDDSGIGASVTITGIGDWLTSEGFDSYRIRIYHSTNDGSGFMPVDIKSGETLLGSPQETNHWTTSEGIRAFVDSGILSADTITLNPQLPADGNRATIAGFQITAVPEPATLMLLGLGGLVLRRKRS